jgi:hypothetical protein
MLPIDLKPEQFNGYPPEARKLVAGYVGALHGLPLSFVPSLLREVIDYDYKFPPERKAIEKELANLNSLSPDQVKEWFQGFFQIKQSPQLESLDWVNSPGLFVEQMSAHLWATHQLDAFRKAAMDYASRLQAVAPPEPPPVPRLGIVVIGQGVSTHDEPLFRKLRAYGGYFNHVNPENGLPTLLDAVAARAKAHPAPYSHWYIDGGQEAEHDPALTCVSYKALEPARAAILRKMSGEIEKPGMGPEALRTLLARMRPVDLGMGKAGRGKAALGTSEDEVLDRFQVKLLTEGSGTQIFSTTFAQWAARETLRRAEPLTLLVRFAPRQRQKPMNELLSGVRSNADLDPAGSLVDADMGSYYTYLNQQRLTGAEKSSFLVWFEGQNEALAIGPAMPGGTQSANPTDLKQLLTWIA